jgi:PAS domain S-box-containing protein
MSEPLRILILEDNPVDAELVQFELQNAGFIFILKVVRASNDFVRELQTFAPHLILSDYDLPQYNGALALAEARRRCPETPFILVSGAITEDRAIEILTQGAKDYVLKKRLQQRLVPAVRRALAEAEEHQARKQAEIELREAHRTLEARVQIRTEELEAEVEARKRVEAELRESGERFHRLLQSIPSVAVQGYGSDGTVQYWNQASERLYGYSEQEAIGRNLLDLIIPPEMRADVERDIPKITETSQPVTASELSLMRKDGSRVAVFSSHAVVQIPGHAPELFCMDIDLTDHKRMEEELIRAHKLESLGILAGGIAHDFNNLMAIVQGYIELALMDLSPDHVSRPRLLAAMQSVEQTQDLTSRLITFSQGGGPHREMLDLTKIIRDAVQKIVKETPVRAIFDFPENLWSIATDELQMKQCFYNLTLNAVEAMPEGGNLTVKMENALISVGEVSDLKKGPYLKITFSDEGSGIPDENLLKAFDPYFSTKKLSARKGLGLGLAVCYSVVKKHHGHISVTSQPGKGTSFVLYLPAQPGPVKGKEMIKTTMSTGTFRVLVMDDEPRILEIARAYLEQMGYGVTTVKEGQEAIDAYQGALDSDHPFDLVMLDLTVRHGLGGQLTMERLLEIDPSIRAIIVSGYVDNPFIEHYDDYGFQGALKKPFRKEEMARLVEEVLHR